MNKCDFCEEFRFKNLKNDAPNKDRVIYTDGDVCLFPTVGCFVEGYLLLASVEHLVSLYDCSVEMLSKIKLLIPKLRDAYREKADTGMIFFEHGTVNDPTLSSVSVSHFHIHFLPVRDSIWKRINTKYDFKYYELSDLSELHETIKKNKIDVYLLLGDADGKIYLIDSGGKNYQSQFLRRVLFEYYYGDDAEKWNWRKHPYYDKMLATKKMFGDIKL